MRKNSDFWEALTDNKRAYYKYFLRLVELGTSMFEWKNVPDSIDVRFLEMCLLADGQAIFFKDEVLGYLALRCAVGGRLNVYQIPTLRTAYAANGFNANLDENNSVIIWNNYLHTNSYSELLGYAKDLYDIERAIIVNAKAQKTPVLITCEENQRLTLKNAYMKYEGNEPFIFADKSLNPQSFKVLSTGAPYVADRLYQLKTEIWNEALTYLGIPNININKKERLISDEVERHNGGTIANRQSRLQMRKMACKEINKMFNLNMDVDFRDAGEYQNDRMERNLEEVEVVENE